MSLNVVVVPEDDRLDKYVLEPVMKAVFSHIGRPHARIRVVSNPRPRGIDTVLTPDYVSRVLARYPMADMFIYCLDRDGRDDRDRQLRTVLDTMRRGMQAHQSAEGVLAVEEVEVWCMVTHVSDLPDSWDTVRQERNPKELYFAPLVEWLLPVPGPGRGRQILGRKAAGNYDLLRLRCPELQQLEQALSQYV